MTTEQTENPFYRKTIPDLMYCYKQPAIKILPDDKRDYYAGTKAIMAIGIRYNLFTLYEIKEADLLITDLLLGMNQKSKFTVHEISLLNNREPVRCYFDFPFKNKISIEIYPLIQKYILTNEFSKLNKSDFRDVWLYTNGYIAWVMAQVYATIFKDYADKAGVWGYCFRDLYIEQINIHKNNIIKVAITE